MPSGESQAMRELKRLSRIVRADQHNAARELSSLSSALDTGDYSKHGVGHWQSTHKYSRMPVWGFDPSDELQEVRKLQDARKHNRLQQFPWELREVQDVTSENWKILGERNAALINASPVRVTGAFLKSIMENDGANIDVMV